MFAFAGLLDQLEAHGDLAAVVVVRGDRTETHSYRALAQRAHLLAGGLVEDGVEPGERIGLYAPNGFDWIVARLAISAAGAVAVAIDDVADEDEAARIIRLSGLRRLFIAPEHLPLLEAMEAAGPKVFLLGENKGVSAEAQPWSRLFADAGPLPALTAAAPAMLVYTSGTTGKPKAFFLRNRHIEVNVRNIAGIGLIGPGDMMLLPLPMHHVYPFVVGLLVPFAVGATVVLSDATTGSGIVRALELTKATGIIGVPRFYEALVAGLESQAKAQGKLAGRIFSLLLGLSVAIRRRLGVSLGGVLFPQVRRRLGPRLRLLISAGAKLAPDVIWKLEGLGYRTLCGYGLAETASAFSGNVPGAQLIGSEGRPFGRGEVRITDPGSDGAGEIQLRGANVFDGYVDDNEANQAAFTADGWFRTGDLGHIEDGFVFVTGRLKELIVLGGGKNVFPEELEKRYSASPLLREVAILERNGGLVAMVFPDLKAIRASGNASFEDVVRVELASVAKDLPSHERLSGFALTREPLPRTRLGKYQRFLLPQLFDDALKGRGTPVPKPPNNEDQALLAAPAAAGVWQILQARFGARLSLDADPQLDLGIDSLEWLSLGLEIESALDISLAEQDFAGVTCVRDLLRLIEARATAPAEPGEKDRRASALARDEAQWLAPPSSVEARAGAILYRVNRGLVRLFFQLQVSGVQHLPEQPPYVLVANHLSDLDPLVVAAALPLAHLNRLYWSGDRGRLFASPLQRRLCRIVHVFPVDERAPGATLAMAGRALAQCNGLIVFPELWRSPDGRLQRFQPGIGRLLAEHPVPAVPALIEGTFEAMPRGRRWPRPHPVHVTFGDPVDVASLEKAGQGETPAARITDSLHSALMRLAKARVDIP